MNKKCYFAIFFLLGFYFTAFAQNDSYSGTWLSENIAGKKEENLNISLHISAAYANVLYPAQLTINYGKTEISYRLLLLKNKSSQLIVGQNKIAAGEFPFYLANSTSLLNGYLTKINNASNAGLQLNVLPFKKSAFQPLADMDSLAITAAALNKLLNKTSYKFRKLNNTPWQSPYVKELIVPGNSGNYYGLTDSLATNKNSITIKLTGPAGNDKKFSASFNEQYLFEKEAPKNFNYSFKKTLQEGQNLICFYAEDFPLALGDSAALHITFADKTYSLNFGESKNEHAGFIVALINYEPPFKEKSIEILPVNNQEVLGRNTLLIDSLYTQQPELTFAIWDDALQDGDSISLSINGKWILQNKLVTNTPQFFKVTVQPGVNNIVFVANNLGSIPPNTSLLEIIDDKQRKAFNISTNLRQNNLVKIIYEVPK